MRSLCGTIVDDKTDIRELLLSQFFSVFKCFSQSLMRLCIILLILVLHELRDLSITITGMFTKHIKDVARLDNRDCLFALRLYSLQHIGVQSNQRDYSPFVTGLWTPELLVINKHKNVMDLCT